MPQTRKSAETSERLALPFTIGTRIGQSQKQCQRRRTGVSAPRFVTSLASAASAPHQA
jgi:hypothetical protein